MSIFTPPNITISKQQLLADKLQQISRIANDCYYNMAQFQTTGIQILWNDSALKPQEIIDALGDNAVKIFQVHGILTDAINQIASVSGITPALATPANAFSIVDGVITVSDNPYTP
jgi:hypothetical protein